MQRCGCFLWPFAGAPSILSFHGGRRLRCAGMSRKSASILFPRFWIALSQSIFAFLGISIRDDVAERKNRAAGFAAAGMTIAATCCAGGATIGDGPGFEVVGGCAVLSTATL